VSYSNGGGGGGSSGCSSYMGSPSNYEEQLMQRSISHSLQKNDGHHHHHQHLFPYLFSELLDTENGPVRRVYSTGDLDQVILAYKRIFKSFFKIIFNNDNNQFSYFETLRNDKRCIP
jgi:hypothetical protein